MVNIFSEHFVKKVISQLVANANCLDFEKYITQVNTVISFIEKYKNSLKTRKKANFIKSFFPSFFDEFVLPNGYEVKFIPHDDFVSSKYFVLLEHEKKPENSIALPILKEEIKELNKFLSNEPEKCELGELREQIIIASKLLDILDNSSIELKAYNKNNYLLFSKYPLEEYEKMDSQTFSSLRNYCFFHNVPENDSYDIVQLEMILSNLNRYKFLYFIGTEDSFGSRFEQYNKELKNIASIIDIDKVKSWVHKAADYVVKISDPELIAHARDEDCDYLIKRFFPDVYMDVYYLNYSDQIDELIFTLIDKYISVQKYVYEFTKNKLYRDMGIKNPNEEQIRDGLKTILESQYSPSQKMRFLTRIIENAGPGFKQYRLARLDGTLKGIADNFLMNKIGIFPLTEVLYRYPEKLVAIAWLFDNNFVDNFKFNITFEPGRRNVLIIWI
jgi:hypothetical protein